jgi:hypothetical protein
MLKPGPYVAISNYQKRLDNDIAVNLGDLVQVYIVFNDGWCLGKNLASDATGVVPIDCLCQVEPELAAEMLLNQKGEQKSDFVEDAITLEHLQDISMQIEPHALETAETTLYFVYKSSTADTVMVWGNFNDWSTPIPLYWEQGSSSFIGFVASDCLNHASLCLYKFIVDDEVLVSPDFPSISLNDDTCNYFVVCSKFIQGTAKEINVLPVERTSIYPTFSLQFEPVSPMVITLRDLEIADLHSKESPISAAELKNTDPILDYKANHAKLDTANMPVDTQTAEILLDPKLPEASLMEKTPLPSETLDVLAAHKDHSNGMRERKALLKSDENIQNPYIPASVQNIIDPNSNSTQNLQNQVAPTHSGGLLQYSILLPLLVHLFFYYEVDVFVSQTLDFCRSMIVFFWQPPVVLGAFGVKLGFTGIVLALLTWQIEQLIL